MYNEAQDLTHKRWQREIMNQEKEKKKEDSPALRIA